MGMFSQGSVMYGGEIDIHASNSPFVELLKMVGNGKRVLEVGPGTGHVTKQLVLQGCKVTCVEQNKNMSDVAKEFCAHMMSEISSRTLSDDNSPPSNSMSLPSEMFLNTYEIQ